MQTNDVEKGVPVVAPSQAIWWSALILFSGILLSTLALTGYGYYQDTQLSDIKEQISLQDAKIQSGSQDRKVLIANILMTAPIRPSIDIKGLLAQFQKVARESQVRLKGFTVQNDVITTSLIATTSNALTLTQDPAITIITMMEKYAKEQQEFSLEPINSLGGDNKRRTTGITLKVVPKPIQ